MATERFDALLDRMASSNVASAGDLAGCSDAEIAALEARYGLRLPQTYRRYLAVMGHRSGRLFTHDHLAVFYPYVLDLTDDLRATRIEMTRDVHPLDAKAPPDFVLPPHALLIAGRLNAAWEFIRCNDPADSSVWFFDENTWAIRLHHASVVEWLEAWCDEAEAAIAAGYFRTNPKGTVP